MVAIREDYMCLRPLIEDFRRVKLLRKKCSDFSSYLRIGSMLRAYAFTEHFGSAEVAMMPLADMLNHNVNGPTALLGVDGSASGSRDASAMSMHTVCRVPQGTQLWNSYGDLGDGALLRRYGFVSGGYRSGGTYRWNPHDSVLVPLERFWTSVACTLGLDPAAVAETREALVEIGMLAPLDIVHSRDGDGLESSDEDTDVATVAGRAVEVPALVLDWPLVLRSIVRCGLLMKRGLLCSALCQWRDEEEGKEEEMHGGGGYAEQLPLSLCPKGHTASASTEEVDALREAVEDRLKAYPASLQATQMELRTHSALSQRRR